MKYKNQLLGLLVAVLIIGAGVNGYYLGSRNPKNIVVKGVDNIENGEIQNVDFGIFWEVWGLLHTDYLKSKDIDDKDLAYGAIEGLAKAAGDPYTVFLPPEDSKKFSEDIQGAFGGIGAEIGYRGDFVVIVAPLKNTPAERAGLKAGDKILAVDGEGTVNVNIHDVVTMIRGQQGTAVTLTILSNGDEKSKEVIIVRDIVKVPTVEWEMKEGNIAHVTLFNFNESAPRELANVLNAAFRLNAEGLVLDLRNNPGGFLEVAVTIAGIFIDSGKEVVSEEFASGAKNPFLSSGRAELKDLPMVVLINKGSASASEILAGALRDHNNVVLIGETTFGKGTVQELKNFPDGSTLKITVAHWVLPSGDIIDEAGIEPTHKVELTEEDIKNEKDPQLDKALEILREKR